MSRKSDVAPSSDAVATDVAESVVKNKSYRVNTTLYNADGTRITSFRPDSMGLDSADVMRDAIVNHFPARVAVTVHSVQLIDVTLPHELRARVAWIRSGSCCPTCGSNHASARADCDDEFCKTALAEGPKAKRTKIDENALLTKLSAL